MADNQVVPGQFCVLDNERWGVRGVVHVIGAFQIFGQVLVLTGGGPADTTRTIVQHIYDTGF